MTGERDMQIARRARLVGAVMAVTMLLWFAVQFLGGQLGLDVRYVFLFDLAALAAFAWALVNVFWIWRARQNDKG